MNFEKALEILIPLVGEKHDDVAKTKLFLSAIYKINGNIEMYEAYKNDALKVLENNINRDVFEKILEENSSD